MSPGFQSIPDHMLYPYGVPRFCKGLYTTPKKPPAPFGSPTCAMLKSERGEQGILLNPKLLPIKQDRTGQRNLALIHDQFSRRDHDA